MFLEENISLKVLVLSQIYDLQHQTVKKKTLFLSLYIVIDYYHITHIFISTNLTQQCGIWHL